MSKILLVENESDLRAELKNAAKRAGFADDEILEATSGEEAKRCIARENFDVVVTDLWMETEKAGLDVTKAAKAKDIYTQVIVITAYGNPEVSVETMALGAFDYIERGSPGMDVPNMLRRKIQLALDFRKAKLQTGY